jgi:uncharacterized FlaG/YvyC family protein
MKVRLHLFFDCRGVEVKGKSGKQGRDQSLVNDFEESAELLSRMNIKGIVNNLIPIDFTKSDLRKTKNSADREPQQGGGGGGEAPQQHRFTDEEITEALKMLRELPGVKENNLQFRVERNDERVVVFIEDPTGKIIRRIPDVELWALMKKRDPNSTRGNLLNKAM